MTKDIEILQEPVEEELVLKPEEPNQITPQEEGIVSPNIEDVYAEIQKRISDVYVTKQIIQDEVKTQIKNFFAANVVVRGKTEPPKTQLEDLLGDIRSRVKTKL